MIVDGAITTFVEQPSRVDEELVKYTKKSLNAGLKQVKEDCFVGDIGAAIQAELEKGGYGIVRDLVGHGVGYSIHEDPNIPNFGKKGRGEQLKAGMTVAIEPMATLGGHKVFIDRDGWTVRTADGSKSAHFEHTVLVTKKGCEILTDQTSGLLA
jgi:methionyl aminopeptidase